MQTLNAKINLLVTENFNLKQGQLEMIAAASEKPTNKPTLFFQSDGPEVDDNKEGLISVIPQSQDPSENSERAFQVETMRLKDELMQARVDNFDTN